MEQRETGAKTGQVRPFWQNKKILLPAAIVVVVLILAGAGYFVFFAPEDPEPAAAPAGNGPANGHAGNGSPGEGDGVEHGIVLPQTRREIDEAGQDEGAPSEDESQAWFGRDPFSGAMRLTGIILGGRRGHMAIIESGNISYLVTVGEVIDETYTVEGISEDVVFLASAEREIELRLHGRAVERFYGDGAEAPEDENAASKEERVEEEAE